MEAKGEILLLAFTVDIRPVGTLRLYNGQTSLNDHVRFETFVHGSLDAS